MGSSGSFSLAILRKLQGFVDISVLIGQDECQIVGCRGKFRVDLEGRPVVLFRYYRIDFCVSYMTPRSMWGWA